MKAMMRSLPLAAALGLVPAAVAAAPSPDLAQAQRHLQAVGTMTASFVQTDRSGRQVGGTLTMKRPGKVRFQYQKGVPLLIVGDGKALTMIDYQVAQVSRWPIGDSPLAVLLDPTKDVSRFARVVSPPGAPLLLIAARDPKHPEYGTITIAFARSPGGPGGLVLQGWTTVDAQNNRSSVTLSNQRFGVPVSDNMFKWNDPRRRTGPR